MLLFLFGLPIVFSITELRLILYNTAKNREEKSLFISCEDTKDLINNKNAQFIDVRTPGEFMSSQLPNAVNIPLQELESKAESSIDRTRPIIVFCRSGSRSEMAKQMLMALGYTEVYNMGSYTSWR